VLDAVPEIRPCREQSRFVSFSYSNFLFRNVSPETRPKLMMTVMMMMMNQFLENNNTIWMGIIENDEEFFSSLQKLLKVERM